jgi:hypothetical protein
MRIDQAINLKKDDIVYNCFMQPLVVQNYITTHPFHRVFVTVTDINSRTYECSFEDLYLENLDGEDDAEKSWINYAKTKLTWTPYDVLKQLRNLYRLAFYEGFNHKLKYSYEEMMQK